MSPAAPGDPSAPELAARLRERAYLADAGLATVLSVSLSLRKPLLLEGESGVGKTEAAKALADVLATRLIRLQCYEGIDVSHALYDWNYARQMLYIRTLQAADAATSETVTDLFGADFIVRRPLLDAIDSDEPTAPVLLIDEIDRADDEFEAFLLELLSDFQVTIPEIGTIHARERPVVILTSNRTRELHDALRRRCLFHWIGYPSVAARDRDRPAPAAGHRSSSSPRRRRGSSPSSAARGSGRRRASPKPSIGSRR